MFENCSKLTILPDISKWKIDNLEEKEDMFEGCNSSLNIPSKFK
jgi:surface protein